DHIIDFDGPARKSLMIAARTMGLILDRFYAEEEVARYTRSIIQKEERLAYALDATDDGLWDWNIEKNEIYFSPQCKVLMGKNPDDAIVANDLWNAAVHPDDAELQHHMLEAFLGGKRASFEVELRISGSGGEWRWIINKGKIVSRDANGKPIRMVGVLTDITKRKTLEEILLDLGERYKNVITNANEGIFIVQDGKLSFCNPKMVDITGYSLDELYAYPLATFIHPDDYSRVSALFSLRLESPDAPNRSTFRIINRFGKEIWIEDSSSTVNWNSAPALLDFITDVTDRMNAKEALKESEERYHHLFLQSPVGIFHFDRDFRVTDCNERLSAIVGSPREKLLGLDLTQINDPRLQSVFEKIRLGHSASFEGEYHSLLTERTANVSLNSAPMKSADDSFSGGIGIVEDITARIKADQIIKQYVKHLVSVDKIGQLITSSIDKETLIQTVIREIRRIFAVDRAWLAYPCDPSAPSWQFRYMSAAAGYEEHFTPGEDRPMTPDFAEQMSRSLSVKAPIISHDADDFHAQMSIAIRPFSGKGWLLGLHQCCGERTWTDEEIKLLRDIAQRLTDALNNYILHNELERVEKYLSSIIDTSSDAIITTDAAGQIIL
ncbi:MAG TPA: PAS domain S-box protein, partial [Spirochaetota bacterium]